MAITNNKCANAEPPEKDGASAGLNIVFLDIDGVLVTTTSSFGSASGTAADPNAVAALNYLLAETDARLVISSTWRLEYTLPELAELLHSWGVHSEVLGITPDASMRSEEIRIWLDEYKGPDSIASFVILDDMSDMESLSARLIATDFDTGLTFQDAERACELMKRARTS